MADAQAKENTGATAENVVSNADTGDTDGQVVAQQEQDGQAGAPAQQEPLEQPQQNTWHVIKNVFFRIFVVWMIASMFKRQPAQEGSDQGGVTTRKPAHNLFPPGTRMDLRVYLSESEHFKEFNDTSKLFWQKKGLTYGDWDSGVDKDGSFKYEAEITATEHMKNNGSMWIHVFLTKSGKSPDPTQKKLYSRASTIYKKKMLNRYKKKRYLKTQNLLTGATELTLEDQAKAENSTVEILSHWHPNMTINLMDDHTPWVRGSVPAPLDEFIDFEPLTGGYLPVLYFNDYWNLNRDFQPISAANETLLLSLTYSPISLFRWQMYAAQNMRSKWANVLGEDVMENDDDDDSLKQAFLETNPYLLGLTIIVSLVHSVFEFLAFKNDIQFWNSRKSLEGLSVRSVFFNVFTSLIVVLYVMDNETNFVVRISCMVGLAIEMWKITKVVTVKLDREDRILGVIPRVRLEDKSTYVESSTKQYDQLAFKYLGIALFPLLGCYAVYSLMYNEHKGWYSYVLNMIYGFLLMFGFIMMTPQLFINYKLKSVAHLPWRMLTYKALNTFIDDLFAFVIQMPMMYRIGCFRDDIVFFIYLYQRYIYRVDPKRVNEFGTTGEDHEVQPNGSIGATPTEGEQPAIQDKPAEEKKTD
ncbi:putative lipid scramblase CLPTM1 [Branchiostoma floridae x Branchiostoma japonicum]